MESSETALLIIDMINDFNFEHGNILAEKALKIADQIQLLKKQCEKENIPIIYINDHYNLWQAELNKVIEYCKNEKSESVIGKIKPTDKDYFLIKPRHSAFYGTALHTLLTQLQVKKLILSGIAGNICVLFTANDAYMREYPLLIPDNCIASVDDEDNHYAIRMMKNVMRAKIFTFKENTSISPLSSS
ncbi:MULTISPECIES: isochorismatase family cysteine hydrolase [Bacillaceae]|uniref:Isochorismatase family cysteine hydrolase n=1 Tax=Niallia hominis TaxID=3133173 RepID=A0ABV1F3U4_9BACI|nr:MULTISPECIES: isochorismatase family cysteine hydrolase [Bacillaceae]MCF2650331.1 cysteine hydrolase [Niallia circulans]CAI9395259.1 Vibriobactin-specific isochorismatase [Bacillus sp. T2.9-1]